MDSKEMRALKRAIDKAGGQSALARACGVKQGHVWHWLNKSRRVPAEQALAVEAATGGAVTRYELRPDIFDSAPLRVKGAAQRDSSPIRRAGREAATRGGGNIADQIAALEAKQHRAVREVLLKQSGGAERLAKLDQAIAALRALGDSGDA